MWFIHFVEKITRQRRMWRSGATDGLDGMAGMDGSWMGWSIEHLTVLFDQTKNWYKPYKRYCSFCGLAYWRIPPTKSWPSSSPIGVQLICNWCLFSLQPDFCVKTLHWQFFQSRFWHKNHLSWMSGVLDVWCPGCLVSWMSAVLDVVSWMSVSWMSPVLDFP